MTEFADVWYRSADGLRLYARDYFHPAPRATLLCMHGLTRNSADFEALCATLNGDFRLIAPDQRGRGRSQYDSTPDNYHPAMYVQDMFALLAHLRIQRIISIGTSMGGLMTMIMAANQPERLRAAILNDVGPVIDPAGLARVKSYIGNMPAAASWPEAAENARRVNGLAFPDYTDEDWLKFARRIYREDENGTLVLACDPAIAHPIAASDRAAVPADAWDSFGALQPVPTLLVRGALSDILSSECVAEMRIRKPDLEVVEASRRGHAPMLDEPEVIHAIRSFLDRVC